jgi:hypothetical protein
VRRPSPQAPPPWGREDAPSGAEPVPPPSMPRGCRARRSPLSRPSPQRAGVRGRLESDRRPGRPGKRGHREVGERTLPFARAAPWRACCNCHPQTLVFPGAPLGLSAGLKPPRPLKRRAGLAPPDPRVKSPSDPGKDLSSLPHAKIHKPMWEPK